MSMWRPGQKEAVLATAKARGMIADTANPCDTATPQGRQQRAATGAAEDSGQASSGPPRSNLRGSRRPNKTEQRFADILEARKRRDEIADYRYEGIRLKWGEDSQTGSSMHYTPDFLVIACGFVCIEVKGAHIFDRDLVRFKGCRAAWPWLRFELWQWKKSEWTRLI